MPKEIFNVSFSELSRRDKPLDIMSCATPERYRLLDCTAAVSGRTLRILEFADFPRVEYAALSYVWQGNCPVNDDSRLSRQEFSVLGAEDADPIGVDVLFDACAASLACGASYLWLDRLCIMQMSKRDRRWQVREMYRVYTFATVCVVAPGGLRFLVPFDEETRWIHRAWTLQEVVAPPSVAVLFAWTHAAGEVNMSIQGEEMHGRIEVVIPRRSAMMGLAEVLGICSAGHFEFTPDSADEVASPLLIETALFGKPSTDVLRGALLSDDILLPNVAALSFATAKNLDTDEMRDFCIWQCALVRTSSRPVDMAFSIMGMLGVMLDPSDFDVDDRLGATIALAREILRQGRNASWLGISVNLPPCRYLSTFPVFPQTSVAGQATYDLPSGGRQLVQLAEAIYPNDIGLFPHHKGSMDETGYLLLDALAVMVVATPATTTTTTMSADLLYDDAMRPTQLKAVDGSTWIISADVATSSDSDRAASPPLPEPRSFAVMLGFYNGIPAVTTGNTLRAMLVTEHAKDRYHVRSYFLLSTEALQWGSTWKKHQFCVGGPEKYSLLEEGLSDQDYVHVPKIHSSS